MRGVHGEELTDGGRSWKYMCLLLCLGRVRIEGLNFNTDSQAVVTQCADAQANKNEENDVLGRRAAVAKHRDMK